MLAESSLKKKKTFESANVYRVQSSVNYSDIIDILL